MITGLNSDDKWRMNKLEGKKPRSVRDEPKPDIIKKETKKTVKESKNEDLSKSNKEKKKRGEN